MRIWFKIFDDGNHLLNDTVIIKSGNENRTRKVFDSLTDVCHLFDLAEPIWLDSNIKEFKSHSKTRFYQDNFIEQIPFLFMEMHVIEED